MEKTALIAPEKLAPATESANRVLTELDKLLLGHGNLHKMVLIGIISRGHILLEGLPGVGKTALVKALSELVSVDFSRIQFTPDLMPSDILGANILQEHEKGTKEMIFHKGPVFTNILLADEINRASPKTQSAMLEAMQEAAVTLLGQTRKLPFPFFVLASQNPIEMEGTYPIPEAQLDRFMFKLQVSSADSSTLDKIISTRRRGELPSPEWKITRETLESLFSIMDEIYLPKAVSRYIARLVAATHPGSDEAFDQINEYVSYGASPRAAIAVAEAARAAALIAGRPAAGFKDVDDVVHAVFNHRMILNYKARMDKVDSFALISSLIENIDEAELDLPDNIDVN